MPSMAHLHGGFRQTQLWLLVDGAHLLMAASEQEAKSDSTLDFARMIFAAKQAHSEFLDGSVIMHPCVEGLLAFSRSMPAAEILCVLTST